MSRTKGNRRIGRTIGTETCAASGRKVRFSSRKRALTAMNGFGSHGKRDPRKPLAVYHCKHCHDWHFTSSVSR